MYIPERQGVPGVIILVECQNCYFVFKENPERPLEACPECGWGRITGSPV